MRRVWPAWGAQKHVVLRELSIAPLRLVVEPRLSRSPPSCVRNPRSYVIVNKLGMDARRAPANLSHRPDESTNLGVNAGPPRLAPLGDLRPVSSESIPIPPRDCVRVDDHQAAGPHWPRAARSDPECPVQVLEQWAEDVLWQFVEAYRRVETIERVTSWLFQVARNKIADSYRKKSPEASLRTVAEGGEGTEADLEDILPDFSESPEKLVIRDAIWNEIEIAVDELPRSQREVFIWHEFEGMSFREMSELTGETENALRLRKHYAMRSLRRRLKSLYNEI